MLSFLVFHRLRRVAQQLGDFRATQPLGHQNRNHSLAMPSFAMRS
jgi:hypothetical protein